MQVLRQSTAITVALGPFLDASDGNTTETALTLTQPDIRLSKNGSSFAQKSAAQTLSHMENGYYGLSLSTTDTDTVGRLRVHCHETGALAVWQDFQVIEEAVYDALFAAGATGLLPANVTEISGDAGAADNLEAAFDGTGGITISGDLAGSVGSVTGGINTAAGTIQTLDALDTAQDSQHAATQTDIASLNDPTAAAIADAVWDETQAAHVVAGSFGEIASDIAAILADTDELQSDNVAGLIAALNDVSAADVWASASRTLTANTNLNDPTAAQIRAEIDANSTQLAAILTDTTTTLPALLTTIDTVVDAIKAETDKLDAAHAEPSGVPTADEAPLDKLGYLFMALRNGLTVTASKKQFHDDADNVEWEKDLSDDGTSYAESEGNAP